MARFKIIPWKWYIVDVTNWHNPVLVREHLYPKDQAEHYLKTNFGKGYDIIKGKEAIKLRLSDWHNRKPGHTHNRKGKYKYKYPDHIKTEMQKKIWRGNRRRAMKANYNKPKINTKVLKEIFGGKTTLFYKRLQRWECYYQAYSEPVKGFYTFKRWYSWPIEVVHLSAIKLCLDKYYDCGPYKSVDIAMYIYDIYPERVIKRLTGGFTSDKNPKEVTKELICRGFISMGYIPPNYVGSINIEDRLVWPYMGWHTNKEKETYPEREYIYDLQGFTGISGYTGVTTAL